MYRILVADNHARPQNLGLVDLSRNFGCFYTWGPGELYWSEVLLTRYSFYEPSYIAASGAAGNISSIHLKHLLNPLNCKTSHIKPSAKPKRVQPYHALCALPYPLPASFCQLPSPPNLYLDIATIVKMPVSFVCSSYNVERKLLDLAQSQLPCSDLCPS